MSENRNFRIKFQLSHAFSTLWSMGCCGALFLLLSAANQKNSVLPATFDKVGKLFLCLDMSPGIWTPQCFLLVSCFHVVPTSLQFSVFSFISSSFTVLTVLERGKYSSLCFTLLEWISYTSRTFIQAMLRSSQEKLDVLCWALLSAEIDYMTQLQS